MERLTRKERRFSGTIACRGNRPQRLGLAKVLVAGDMGLLARQADSYLCPPRAETVGLFTLRLLPGTFPAAHYVCLVGLIPAPSKTETLDQYLDGCQ